MARVLYIGRNSADSRWPAVEGKNRRQTSDVRSGRVRRPFAVKFGGFAGNEVGKLSVRRVYSNSAGTVENSGGRRWLSLSLSLSSLSFSLFSLFLSLPREFFKIKTLRDTVHATWTNQKLTRGVSLFTDPKKILK